VERYVLTNIWIWKRGERKNRIYINGGMSLNGKKLANIRGIKASRSFRESGELL
jgi:hypothetical protein